MERYIDADAVIKEIDAAQDSLEFNNDEMWEINRKYYKGLCWARRIIEDQPTADVAPRAEVLEAVVEFKNDLMDVFIGLCNGNDYDRLNLLKIGDTVARIYNKHIAEIKKKYK